MPYCPIHNPTPVVDGTWIAPTSTIHEDILTPYNQEIEEYTARKIADWLEACGLRSVAMSIRDGEWRDEQPRSIIEDQDPVDEG